MAEDLSEKEMIDSEIKQKEAVKQLTMNKRSLSMYDTPSRLILCCFVCIFGFKSVLHTQIDSVLIDSLTSVINNQSDTNQVNAYYFLGKHYFNNNNMEEGYPIMVEVLPLALKSKMHLRSGTIYEFIGLYHDMSGNLEEAV